MGGIMSESWEWRHRRGPFRDIEEDTEERQQVMPGKAVPAILQTHTPNGGTYHDGASEDMDS